jgi:hypothetical protein
MKTLVALFLTASALAAPVALAVPPIPDVTDCHELNKLLHIDNVRDCNG